jgi:NhaB family Na+:H+ antiporter
MVAGIYFMRDLLLFTFTKILIKIRSKIVLSLLFCFAGAILSAFLDALTVTAVLISVAIGFYSVYHKVASGKNLQDEADHNHSDDITVLPENQENLEQFRSFLRNLIMHGAVGTALGGVTTVVGEPQNLLIAKKAGWNFMEFFFMMAPVTMPVLACGLLTCVLLEKLRWFGYGTILPDAVRAVLEEFDVEQSKKLTSSNKAALVIQVLVALFLVIGLALHIAPVGLIGLSVIVLLTAFNGVIEEHRLGHAFEEALPFTALLVVFFAIVAVIHDQHLFKPIIDAVLAMEVGVQPVMFFAANGILSAISDNVFVATVYINEVRAALDAGTITRDHFDLLTIAINTGTNLPSVATPNGQAAFLFLLTSALAPLIRLSYGRMVYMALPYTIVLSVVGCWAVIYML